MATKQSTVDFLEEQVQKAGIIRSRKMFGEYALYCNEKVVALICDDQLFVKKTTISTSFLDKTHEASPYPGAKSWIRVPEERWDDPNWLTAFIQKTAATLPLKKAKKKKTNT
jgi:TfoX/Sxy family transcriptional regulator of competence genes